MITMRDKMGYALGDVGCQLTFGLVGAFLQMFHSDILGLTLQASALLMLVSRLWDASTDPVWGGLVDRWKPGRHGRFRPWLLWSAVPLAIAAVVMFTDPGMGPRGNLIWAYATFIGYGIFYTTANISYGAMASVISPLENDRAALSTFRSAGAGLGALPAVIVLPMLVFFTDAAGNDHLSARNLQLSVAALAVVSIGALAAAFFMTKERVVIQNANKPQARKTLAALLRNRPFIIICLASMLHIGAMLFIQTINGFLFKDYFGQGALFGVFNAVTFSPMALLFPFIGPMVRRFGKKELCAAGLVISVVAFGAAFLLELQNPWAYMVFGFFGGLGMTFFTMQVWALVTDVLDYQSLLSGQRDEGTAFGAYFFARKLGHTLAGSGGALVLSAIGYAEGTAGTQVVQTPEVALGIYRAATLVPAIALLGMFLLLAFVYPLNKQRLKEMHVQMELAKEVQRA